jgi:hypothetical protein
VRLADLPGFDGACTVNSAGVAQVDGHRFPGPGAAAAEIIRAHARLPRDQL